MLARALLGQALVVALIATRLAGFVIVSPFPGETTGRSARVGFVLLLAWFIASTLPPVGVDASRLGHQSVFAVVGELAIGILIGLAFRTVLGAAEVGGELVAQATGLGSASLFNPTTHAQETPVARLLWIAGAMVTLTTGAHRVVLGYVLASFHAIPLGSPIDPGAAAPVLLDLVVASVTAGLRLAFPVVAAGLVVQVALALVARTAPALGVFQIGLSLLVAVGLVVLGLSFPSIVSQLQDLLASVPSAIERMLDAAS